MADAHDEWTEEDAKLYREIAMVAVPARDEQIATVLALLPFAPEDSFRVVELGCGEGALTFALLDCFPSASVTALDGSPSMVAHAARSLRGFGPRVSVMPFSLTAREWLSQLDAADGVVSSLCLHHLSAEEKQRLFAQAHGRLSERGAFLIADVVEPQRGEACAMFAAAWDRVAEAQSVSRTGSRHPFGRFVAERWNYYRFPDPSDRPSPLFDQLVWLKGVGFEAVDCFWLQAGHAVYGGYKARTGAASQHLPFAAALRAAQAALRVTSQAA